jgi:hypothetical protein
MQLHSQQTPSRDRWRSIARIPLFAGRALGNSVASGEFVQEGSATMTGLSRVMTDL